MELYTQQSELKTLNCAKNCLDRWSWDQTSGTIEEDTVFKKPFVRIVQCEASYVKCAMCDAHCSVQCGILTSVGWKGEVQLKGSSLDRSLNH